MIIDIISIFPEMFESAFGHSLLKKAQDEDLIDINLYNLRDFIEDRHRQVDDVPYGGGSGMVMKPEPFFEAVLKITGSKEVEKAKKKAKIILLSPQGRQLDQKIVEGLSGEKRLILLCGRYEGVDERVRSYLATDELSIGDYILSGGEIPVMVLVDAIARFVPGVVGDERSLEEESFASELLEYPQYTRPQTYRAWKVPDILLSGDHRKIAEWRRKKALENTFEKRRDLLKKASLTRDDKEFLEILKKEPKIGRSKNGKLDKKHRRIPDKKRSFTL